MHLTLLLEGMGGTTTGFVVPDEVVDELGGGRRPPVVVTIGPHTWRTSIARMGGIFCLGVSRENRELAGIAAGDVCGVEVALDSGPRTVELPADLETAIGQAGLREAWDRLALTHRKEHVRAVEEARRPETRARRIARAVEMLGG